MKIILTGGTGFIGAPLRERLLKEGHDIILLTRNPSHPGSHPSGNLKTLLWDGKNPGPWSAEIGGTDAIINLAGEPIAAKRWSDAQKKRIRESRLDATKAVVSAIQKAAKKPHLLINASAVGYYGNVSEGEVAEDAPRGTGFLAETCTRWEETARSAEPLGLRVIRLRIGVVLEKDGGALQKMLPPFRFFLGGPLGNGRQWFPWVHREDVIGVILFALKTPNLSGPVNLNAPQPVTMKEFCTTLGQVLHRPSWAPVPATALRLLLGEMSDLLLSGQKAVPKKLLEAGFVFKHPNLEEALKSLFY
jgi:hypothetical protein